MVGLSVVIGAAFVVVLGGGCRTPPLDMPITDDFGNNNHPADLSNVAPRDLSVSTMGCAALINCIDGCSTAQCQTDCFDNASVSAQTGYDNATECVYNFCLEPNGKRPARCVMEADGSFDDPPDGGVGVCDQCLENAYAQLGGYNCQPTNDPDCNPAQCASQVTQCLSN